ncbi:MAG: hypothetical protein IH623_21565 [Verrucomicrobia bacterium]|nr:hypothetical protein [Verrucomicrobiota bacterium]
MKALVLIRKMHLYLGCAFAPLLILFSVTGAWQTLMLHRAAKDESYRPPALIQHLSSVHLHQQWGKTASPGITRLVRGLVVMMAFSLVLTAGLGILMAFKFCKQKWPVWACLLGGVAVPILLLWLA